MQASKDTFIRAKILRRSMTLPEVKLWSRLRAKRAGGFKFRRQHPLGPYILDFFCPAARLAIEVDSKWHDDRDHGFRDHWLDQQGIETLRIPARVILEDADQAVDHIVRAARCRVLMLGQRRRARG